MKAGVLALNVFAWVVLTWVGPQRSEAAMEPDLWSGPQGAIHELTSEEQITVRSGGQVMHSAPAPDSTWPQLWVYEWIDATPEEAMAVFSDFNRQHEYLPDVAESRVVRRASRSDFTVSYSSVTHFPLHSHEAFTVKQHLSCSDGRESFRVDWVLLSADNLKGNTGNVRFEAMGSGALLAYYSNVIPPAIAAGVADKEIDRIHRTAHRISERVLTVKSSNPGLLSQELSFLRQELPPQ